VGVNLILQVNFVRLSSTAISLPKMVLEFILTNFVGYIGTPIIGSLPNYLQISCPTLEMSNSWHEWVYWRSYL